MPPDQVDGMERHQAWTDEEIDAIADRIKRFGWPYEQHARGVVKVLLAEVDRLRPATDRGAVEECDRLRDWINAFGRESTSISVDDVLAASRRRVPPLTRARP